ncbi:MAG: hypothetical protein H8E19_14695 [Deltaproteobacteria bacterium]|uniref:Uncharacterized protein n=1 Tax=Candidatus Desulfacyla euxinica TaxID=2841693 RepID=A0A8J6N339_9DELT|nr:hypothetical protein [Candidatus Desulfacyla euxinica]
MDKEALTYEDVLTLHGVDELPFIDTEDMKRFAIRGTQNLLARNGAEWIKEHRVRLIEELELIAGM